MSLLVTVDEAIKSCKAEQAKINGSIQLYREILLALTSQPKTGNEDSDPAEYAAATDTSPGEKEDIELLEQALKKALQIRTGTGSSKQDSNTQSAPRKEPSATVVTSKERTFAASKSNQTSTKSTSKSVSLDRNKHKRPAGIFKQKAARQSLQAVSASGSLGPGQLHTSTLPSKNRTIRSGVLSGNDLGKAAAISTSPSNNTAPLSPPEESGAPPGQNGIVSNQTLTWKSLRRKQSRLWEKIAAVQRKPVPGRSRFMERMSAMFPTDWPCGSPDQTRALVDRLTHQGHDLTQRCQMMELLSKQSPEAAAEPGGETLERLQTAAAELHNFAGQVKREWEAWDRWRPEGGCLCPTGANGARGDGMIPPLPPTITYTTEAELREFEKLRTRVALLQQEIYLEQALLDTLSPQLSSIAPGPQCPDASVLRDVYSLLGEGGQRSPAIVLDSEPD